MLCATGYKRAKEQQSLNNNTQTQKVTKQRVKDTNNVGKLHFSCLAAQCSKI